MTTSGQDIRYAAFVSYAHADQKKAKYLQRSLETYSLPRNLKPLSKQLSPIFRDVTELTASHSLSEKISDAVKSSRFLIVLCSPAAKKSRWVNEEIRLFRRLHGEQNIFCAIIEGTPETAFPSALFDNGLEPLAADMTGQKESLKLGVTQIVAAMLDVGLDDLILRERQRLRRRVMAITALSSSIILLLSFMTWTAIDARNEAEQRREDAEILIEFMLTDLRDGLEAVGRLEILQSAGDEAARYYEKYELSELDDDSLGQRASVFHFLGEVQDKLGNLHAANEYFKQAYDATDELLIRNPTNPDRIFEHAQSVWYLANRHYEIREYNLARPYYEHYLFLAKSLYENEGPSERALLEQAYAHSNLGQLAKQEGRLQQASQEYDNSIAFKLKLFNRDPNRYDYMVSVVDAYAKQADLSFENENLDEAIEFWRKADSIVKQYYELNGSDLTKPDARIQFKHLLIMRALGRLLLYQGDIEAAKIYIEEGLSIAGAMQKIETDNVDVVFEKILIEMLDFEVAFSREDFSGAQASFDRIKTQTSQFPIEFKETKRYKELEKSLTVFPLYLSILSGNPKSINALSSDYLSDLPSSFYDVDDADFYSLLSRVVLVDLISNNPRTEALLSELCRSETISLDWIERQLLNTHMKDAGCLHSTNSPTLSTVFSKSYSLYNDTQSQRIGANHE